MEVRDAMRTTFACRSFTGRPVADDVLHGIFDAARFAPTGGNRQGVRVIIVRDEAIKARLAPLMQEAMNLYLAQRAAGHAPRNTIDPAPIDEAAARAADHPGASPDWLLQAPVTLVFTVDLSVTASTDSELDRVGVTSGASVYPFVWNVLLAARDVGVGGVITTALTDAEPAAQQILGIPSHHAIAAAVPLGYPQKRLTKLSRLPVEELVTIDRFDGPPFEA